MTREQKIYIRCIQDLAETRLRNPPLDPHVEHDLKEIARITHELLDVPRPFDECDARAAMTTLPALEDLGNDPDSQPTPIEVPHPQHGPKRS